MKKIFFTCFVILILISSCKKEEYIYEINQIQSTSYNENKDKLKSIDYGHGNIKPALWGYRSPQQKKKRK